MPVSKKRRLLVVGGAVAVCLLAAVVVMAVLVAGGRAGSEGPSVSPPAAGRIDCFPEAIGGLEEVSARKCRRRGCVFDDTSAGDGGPPSCFYPRDVPGYTLVAVRSTALGFSASLSSSARTPFGANIKDVVLEVESYTETVLRFKFDDAQNQRYQVPIKLNLSRSGGKPKKTLYDLKITNNETFSFQIIRRSNGRILWDTSVGGLAFSDQFGQIATKLPSKNIYGLGENVHKSFRHDLNYRTWPMFSRDQPPSWGDHRNLYGVHPFYTCLEDDGKSHGVLILNSNAQEYHLTPLPMLVYRTLGGVLDMYMFLGPEPETVIGQYTQVIGRPFMPPYWSLGFQLCRYGYGNLSNLRDAVERTKMYGIPHDVQYADIDHMDERKDFTVDDVDFHGLSDYFEHLRDNGMRIIIILDPCLISNETNYRPYDLMKNASANIKWPSNYTASEDDRDETNAILGYVWPRGKTVFPDFFKSKTRAIWRNLIVEHRKKVPFDGLWIDMNEPANFGTNEERPFNWPETVKPYWSLKCPENKWEDPPYRSMAAFVYDDKSSGRKGRLSDKTICMTARQGEKEEYRHYDVHSLYGWSQTESTLDGIRRATNERGLVISRSTFPGSGKHAGHWLGDNQSAWKDLKDSVIGILEFNLFGIPYIGADICGFFQNTTVELCKRWMQLGAFYPYSRNHNGINYNPQDPGMFGDEVGNASREALLTRYELLPFLYTLFHHAHTEGHTVVRSLHHEFPTDSRSSDIDTQFLWGPALLIVPILEKGQTSLNAYLPHDRWYDFYEGSVIETNADNRIELNISPDSKIPLFVREGFILPTQEPANNSHYSRMNFMGLIVALSSQDDKEATGDLFWDDGVKADTYENAVYFYSKFRANQTSLLMHIENNSTTAVDNLFIDSIKLIGVKKMLNVMTVSGGQATVNYNNKTKVLKMTNLKLPLNQNFQLTWS